MKFSDHKTNGPLLNNFNFQCQVNTPKYTNSPFNIGINDFYKDGNLNYNGQPIIDNDFSSTDRYSDEDGNEILGKSDFYEYIPKIVLWMLIIGAIALVFCSTLIIFVRRCPLDGSGDNSVSKKSKKQREMLGENSTGNCNNNNSSLLLKKSEISSPLQDRESMENEYHSPGGAADPRNRYASLRSRTLENPAMPQSIYSPDHLFSEITNNINKNDDLDARNQEGAEIYSTQNNMSSLGHLAPTISQAQRTANALHSQSFIHEENGVEFLVTPIHKPGSVLLNNTTIRSRMGSNASTLNNYPGSLSHRPFTTNNTPAHTINRNSQILNGNFQIPVLNHQNARLHSYATTGSNSHHITNSVLANTIPEDSVMLSTRNDTKTGTLSNSTLISDSDECINLIDIDKHIVGQDRLHQRDNMNKSLLTVKNSNSTNNNEGQNNNNLESYDIPTNVQISQSSQHHRNKLESTNNLLNEINDALAQSQNHNQTQNLTMLTKTPDSIANQISQVQHSQPDITITPTTTTNNLVTTTSLSPNTTAAPFSPSTNENIQSPEHENDHNLDESNTNTNITSLNNSPDKKSNSSFHQPQYKNPKMMSNLAFKCLSQIEDAGKNSSSKGEFPPAPSTERTNQLKIVTTDNSKSSNTNNNCQNSNSSNKTSSTNNTDKSSGIGGSNSGIHSGSLSKIEEMAKKLERKLSGNDAQPNSDSSTSPMKINIPPPLPKKNISTKRKFNPNNTKNKNSDDENIDPLRPTPMKNILTNTTLKLPQKELKSSPDQYIGQTNRIEQGFANVVNKYKTGGKKSLANATQV